MPKYQIAIDEIQQYVVLVEAANPEEAQQIASDYVGTHKVDSSADSSETKAILSVSEDTDRPFPRTEDDLLRDTLPAYPAP